MNESKDRLNFSIVEILHSRLLELGTRTCVASIQIDISFHEHFISFLYSIYFLKKKNTRLLI